MKTRALLFCTFLYALVGLTGCGDSGGDLSKALVTDLNSFRDIMVKNMDTPAEGMKAMRTYAEDHLPTFMRNLTQIAVDISKMTSAEERAKRVKQVAEDLKPALKSLNEQGDKFSAKAAADPKANELRQQWTKDSEATFKEIGTLMQGFNF